MKFAAMCSSDRDQVDKYQDAHDFICMARFNGDIDLEKLGELGNLVYSDGGTELQERVRKVRAGEKLNF